MSNYLVGVSLNVCGSISINLGTNLIKYAYSQHPNSTRPPVWYVGMVIFVVGNIVNFISFSFAAQSLLAALEPAFVTNVILGYILLKQKVQKRTIAATLAIVAGNVIVVLFSSQRSDSFTTDELITLYANPAYITYLVVSSVFCAIGFYFYRRLYAIVKSDNGEKLRPWMPSFVTALYALLSGLIGTQSIIFAKALSNVVILTLNGDNQLSNPFSYLILVCWLFTMVFWLRRMNNALIIFKGNTIIPVLQVVWIIFGVISGGLYYQEFQDFTGSRTAGFICGMFLIIGGVAVLAPEPSSDTTHRESSIDLEGYEKLQKTLVPSSEEDDGLSAYPMIDRLTIAEYMESKARDSINILKKTNE